jgi:hypothetical protein
MIIFAADHPRVLDGTYDQEGYTPKERRAQIRSARRGPLCPPRGNSAVGTEDGASGRLTERNPTMRLFDDDRIGCYLDDIGHRLEKTKDGKEIKVVDLTLRVQPFTPELAVSLDPDVRALLFSMTDATPKPKLKEVRFNLTVPRQQLAIALLPELAEQLVLCDCDVSGVRARSEKGVDGFGLVFYVSYGPASPRELEYVCDWLTQQRFITFQPQQPALDFAAKDKAASPRRGRRKDPPVATGDELRPGVHAEH